MYGAAGWRVKSVASRAEDGAARLRASDPRARDE